MRYENAFLNTQWKAEELFMVSSQLFISYKQNQSILLWRPTFNLKSGVLASATWLRERHDMRSMYIVALMTSGKRSWPQERLVLKLSNSGPPRMSSIAPRDQFKPIRIGENLVVNYKGW